MWRTELQKYAPLTLALDEVTVQRHAEAGLPQGKMRQDGCQSRPGCFDSGRISPPPPPPQKLNNAKTNKRIPTNMEALTQNSSLVGGGGLTRKLDVQFMFAFKNYVIKIM